MTRRPLQRVLHHLRSATGSESIADAQLLERFVQEQDEAAFELLVRRHERLVLGACRRILRNPHDVDDAFQATFLTLVRKAGSVGKGESIGSWLYKVAFRIALRANAKTQRQTHRERTGLIDADFAGPGDPATDLQRRELRPLLDQEIHRLPAKYRAAVILCYLEGKNYDEAALELGCPKGTLSTRLTRARELLRDQLTRRGLTLTATALGALLAEESASAQGIPPLINITVHAGSSLLSGSGAGTVSPRAMTWMEGVVKAMFYTRVKIVTLCAVALVFLGTTIGVWTAGALADPGNTEKPGPATQAKGGPEAPAGLEQLQGTWQLVGGEKDGQPFSKRVLDKERYNWMTITGNKLIDKIGDLVTETILRIDARQRPHTVDLLVVVRENVNGVEQKRTDVLQRGIYERKGDVLRICLGAEGKERPRAFPTAPDSSSVLSIYRRIDPAQVKPEKIAASPEFDRAEVTVDLLKQDPPGKRAKTLTDRAEIAKLVTFFPGVGTGREAPIAGGYVPVARVKLERKGGPTITVQIAPAYEFWSEGKGDWKAKPGLKAHLDQLFEPQFAGEMGWSKPLNHLRGRLRLRSWETSFGTEMPLLYVELENVGRWPLEVGRRPGAVKITVFDEKGQMVKESGLPRSGPGLPVQFAAVPGGAYVGFGLHCRNVGIPQILPGALLALENGDWLLKPGRYTLRATYEQKPAGGFEGYLPKNADVLSQWVGRLELPALEIDIHPPRKQKADPAQ
jgi:RNA polymerase sigma factor (sigma-70 family)